MGTSVEETGVIGPVQTSSMQSQRAVPAEVKKGVSAQVQRTHHGHEFGFRNAPHQLCRLMHVILDYLVFAWSPVLASKLAG